MQAVTVQSGLQQRLGKPNDSVGGPRSGQPTDAGIAFTKLSLRAESQPWTDAEDRREDELSGLAQRSGDSMHATGITANLSVADLAEAREFYLGFLGLSVEGFNLGWVVNLRSPDGRAVVQLVTRDATSPVDSVISVHVGDEVDAAYEEAQRRGFEIVHPLTTEPWGCAGSLSVRQTATSSTLSTTRTKTANTRMPRPPRGHCLAADPRG